MVETRARARRRSLESKNIKVFFKLKELFVVYEVSVVLCNKIAVS